MIKLVAAISAAALLTGLIFTVVPGLSSNVEAHNMAAKGDRLDLKPYGRACSEQAWPHFEAACLRNMASPTREARPVRVVATDRLPGLNDSGSLR